MADHFAEARAHSAAAPSAVYALLTTGATWPTWIFVDSAELERPGADGAEGVGAVRVYRFAIAGLRGRSREQVLELVPDRKFAYTVLAGVPVRDHRADVDLTPTPDGGTDIRWSATWVPRYPGTGALLRWSIGFIYRRFSAGLARKAAEA
jgi:uncharacterized protein YndB with AHSA1/START domain